MPEILIDISRLAIRCSRGRLPTGVDRVCLAYVHHFGPRARAVLRKGGWTWILPKSASQRLFALLLTPPHDFDRALFLLLAANFPFPWKTPCAPGAILFNVGHSGLDRPDYARWLAKSGCRPIYMVHDLIPLTHPEFCRPGEDARHRLRLQTILKTAAAVVTNSRATLDELTAFAATAGLPLPPSTAAPLAAWSLPLPATTSPIPFPYFIMLGTIEPRKNHWLILQVWRRLVEIHGAAAPRLVLVGQRGWECENVVDMLERCSFLKDHVIELSGCSDTALSTYLFHARALLFPAFTEGYGLPLAEALAMGTPVIASDLKVFKEVFGMIPEYCDPLDSICWLETILDYTAPTSRKRKAQKERLPGLALPTWEDHFSGVEELLAQVRGSQFG
jgi:glycosyltransferase involved in cell wall biosynthesis